MSIVSGCHTRTSRASSSSAEVSAASRPRAGYRSDRAVWNRCVSRKLHLRLSFSIAKFQKRIRQEVRIASCPLVKQLTLNLARHLADNAALPNTPSITIKHLITKRHRYNGPMTRATPFTSDGLT